MPSDALHEEAQPIDGYTDYRRFVKDMLAELGRQRSELAEALGLSDSMLSQVLSKKRRLRATMVPVLAEFLGLDEAGHQMLAALVDLDNESARARRTAWATIQARQRFLAQEKSADDILEVMSSWHVAAVYELAACDGFVADPVWIAGTLNPAITEKKASDAIQTLLRAGLLEPTADGSLHMAQEHVFSEHTIPVGARSRAVRRLQNELLELAKRSNYTFRSNERHHTSAVFAVSESKFAMVTARLRAIEQELLMLLTQDEEGVEPSPPNRVMALSMNLFPVSEYSDVEYVPEPAPAKETGLDADVDESSD